MPLFVDDDDPLFLRDGAEDPETVHVDDAGSKVSNMIVEEYSEEVMGQDNQEQFEQGSVVGDQAPWQHVSISECNEVEREVDLMVMMLHLRSQ